MAVVTAPSSVQTTSCTVHISNVLPVVWDYQGFYIVRGTDAGCVYAPYSFLYGRHAARMDVRSTRRRRADHPACHWGDIVRLTQTGWRQYLGSTCPPFFSYTCPDAAELFSPPSLPSTDVCTYIYIWTSCIRRYSGGFRCKTHHQYSSYYIFKASEMNSKIHAFRFKYRTLHLEYRKQSKANLQVHFTGIYYEGCRIVFYIVKIR